MKYWLPVDHYEGGSEHVTLHLLYSRFWHKVLNDLEIIPYKEPYNARSIHGVVWGEGHVKMSKSLGNIVSPDDLVDQYGADVTRAYLMFMGPYEADCDWNPEAIKGVSKFVSRYYSFLLDAWNNSVEVSGEKESKAVTRLVEKTKHDILEFKFNTTISALMEFYNEFSKGGVFSKDDLEKLIVCIAPAMPHISEEIWVQTGHGYSVHMQEWPEIDESLLEDDTVEVPVQINGKVRGRVIVNADASEEKVREIVMAEDVFKSHLGDEEIKKFIYVPGKIVNIVK